MITLGAREHHRFEAAGKPFVYLVPSAAIFALDDAADAILRTLSERPRTREELVAELSARHDHAELAPTGGAAAKPLRARAHLLVTVPVYMAWFASEGGK